MEFHTENNVSSSVRPETRIPAAVIKSIAMVLQLAAVKDAQ